MAPRPLRVFPDAGRVEHALLEAALAAPFVDATGFWSFSQLVEACVPEGLAALSKLEARLLVSAAVRELPDGPFGEWAHDALFAHEAAELFVHLATQLATADQLERASADAGSSRGAWLARLWRRFAKKKAEARRYDAADRLGAAVRELERGLPEALRGFSRVEVHHLYDLPPLRLAFLHQLEAACRGADLTVALHLPRADNPAIDALVNEVHSELERRYESSTLDLQGHASEGPFAALPLFFEQEAAVEAPGLDGFSAATPREEAREIARRVRARLDAGAAPEEIAVVYRDLAADTEALLEALDERGVPARARLGVPLTATAAGHLALGLPLLVDEGFPARQVSRYLSSRYLTRLWESDSEPGVFFAQAGLRDDVLGADGARGAYAVRLHALATRFAEGWPQGPADEVRGVARQVQRLISAASAIGAEDTLLGHVRALAHALEQLGLFEGLRALDRSGPDERALARDQAAGDALRALLSMLSDAAKVSGISEVKLSRRDFSRWLHDAAGELNLLSKGPRAGAVSVLEARELPGRTFRHLFIGGLVDGRFPGRGQGGGLLADDERGAINGAARAPLFRLNVGEREARLPLRLAEDRLLFHLALSAATETVTLSYPRAEALGRSFSPSAFLQELARAVTGFEVKRLPRPVVPPAERVSNTAEWRLRALLDGARPDEPWARLAAELAEMEHQRLRFFGDEAAAAGPHSGAVTGEDVAALLATRFAFDEQHPLSARTLNAWGNCAFAGFLSDVLGLEPLEGQGEDLDSRSRGTLLHRVLELLLPVVRSPPANLQQVVEAAVDEAASAHERRAPTGHPLLWKLAREKLVRDVSELIASGRARPFDGYLPEKSEFKLQVAMPGEPPIHVKGTLDRVDYQGRAAAIIDYKSSVEDPAELVRDLLTREWQLPIYAWALKAAGLADTVDAALVPLKDDVPRRLSDVATKAGVSLAELLATDELTRARLRKDDKPNLANAMHGLVERMRSGDFGARPMDCGYCPHRAVCRISTRKLHEEGR